MQGRWLFSLTGVILLVFAVLAGAPVEGAPDEQGDAVPFDPDSAEHREHHAWEARLAARALTEKTLGVPLERRVGRRYPTDPVFALDFCLRQEGAESSGEASLIREIRRRLEEDGIRFASEEAERVAFDAHVAATCRAYFEEFTAHLKEVTGGDASVVTKYRIQECQRVADPVRNPAGLVLPDPLLAPSSAVMRRAQLPEADLAAYRDLLKVALKTLVKGFGRWFEAEDLAPAWFVARALRIQEHGRSLFGEEWGGTASEMLKFEALLRNEIREHRAQTLTRVTPRVASLLEHRIPEDVVAAKYRGPSLYSASVTWILSGLLQNLWWGLQLDDDPELPWPEDRLVESIRWFLARRAESLERGEGSDLDRRATASFKRLEATLSDGLFDRLRQEARATPCYERINPLWYFREE